MKTERQKKALAEEILSKIEAKHGSVKQVTCWAICDNDGGRLITPVPLAWHIYATPEEAKQVARTNHFAEEYYPVRKVIIHA